MQYTKPFLGLFFIFLLAFSNVLAQKNPIVIVIDPGHGGGDPGKAHSSKNLHHEKTLNLEIALRAGEMIENELKNVKVLYTRTEDKYVDLRERTDFANAQNADFFISIHCNSNPSAAVSGSEVHIHSLKLSSSKKLATLIGEELQKNTGKRFRGIVESKQRGRNLFVTQYTDMPSVLVELGYMSNPTEEKYLNSEEGQDKMADALFKACKRFISLHLPRENRQTIYRVQVLATSTLVDIESDLFEKLEEKVDIIETQNGEKYKYKYLIGREYEQAQAAELAKKVEKLGFKGAFVVKLE
jgi:N-acetylmuramoyl-L-alanine amidase